MWANMAERRVSERLVGQRVKSAFSITYVPGDGVGSGPAEAIEFLSDANRSILLTGRSDWELEISEGHWPTLPSWAWPVESWRYEKIDGIGGPGMDEILEASELVDSVGEPVGVRLRFASACMTIRCGDSLTWTVSPEDTNESRSD